jgi:hypothetical protein
VRRRAARFAAVIALLLGLGLAIHRLAPAPLPARPDEWTPPSAPQPTAPAPAAAPQPVPEPDSTEAPAPPSRRDAVRALLEQSIAEHFPDRKLSSDEIDLATDALMRLRAARLELKALPRTAENAERIRELTAELGQASADFEYLVDVDPITFTERASGGFDADDEEETE